MVTAGGTDMESALARLGLTWGWIVAYGALSVLAGGVAIVWPGSTLVVNAVVFSLQLLVGAVYQFLFVFANPPERGWVAGPGALVSIPFLGVFGFLFGRRCLKLPVVAIL